MRRTRVMGWFLSSFVARNWQRKSLIIERAGDILRKCASESPFALPFHKSPIAPSVILRQLPGAAPRLRRSVFHGFSLREAAPRNNEGAR
jgi:hypothetical protein